MGRALLQPLAAEEAEMLFFLAHRMNKLSGDDCSFLEAREHRASSPSAFTLSPAGGQRAEFAMAGACGTV